MSSAGSGTVLVVEDQTQVRRALSHLLEGAGYSVLTAENAEGALEICDDGPGVPEANRVNIFKPYVTMRPKGVGLGLAIVQQIVAAHRWEIACFANEPRGAIFRLTHLKTAAARN